MQDFVERLLAEDGLGKFAVHHRHVPGRAAEFRAPALPLPEELASALAQRKVERLYSHQADALDAARARRDVLAVTPTASGKTLVFALPVLETILAEPGAKALFLYP